MITVINKSENDLAYQTLHSVGFDICSNESVIIKPYSVVKVRTGLFIDTDTSQKDCAKFSTKFYEIFGLKARPQLELRPRSGFANKGLQLTNSPATIEIDYADEILVSLKNTTPKDWYIHKGERVVQGVVGIAGEAKGVDRKNVVRTGGFGSTG